MLGAHPRRRSTHIGCRNAGGEGNVSWWAIWVEPLSPLRFGPAQQQILDLRGEREGIRFRSRSARRLTRETKKHQQRPFHVDHLGSGDPPRPLA